MAWRYGGMQGGRDQAYWEAHPEELMQRVLQQDAPRASLAYRDYLTENANRQYALWNAYKASPNLQAGQTVQPLGDWLSASATGQNAVRPPEGMPAFYQALATRLMGGGQAEKGWREAVNPAGERYNSALEVMMQGANLAPIVSQNMRRNAWDTRQQYGGLGEAGPPSYYEWLYRRLLGQF